MSCINEQSPDSYYQGFALVAGGGFRTPPAFSVILNRCKGTKYF